MVRQILEDRLTVTLSNPNPYKQYTKDEEVIDLDPISYISIACHIFLYIWG